MAESNTPDPQAGHAKELEELPVKGFKGTPEEIERQWFDQIYTGRGDSMLQLTWRAIIMGGALGGILSLTNLYIGLKAGWAFGVAITACILSYAIWTFLYKIRIAKTPMTILENNCMQSTASSAGYSTGGTLVSAFAAYIILNHQTMHIGLMIAWVFFLALLGVTMAIPMKRQMINTEQLRFPSGVAAAETLRALHSRGSQGMRSAKALGIAGGLAVLSKFWTDGLHLISPNLESFQISTWISRLNEVVFGPTWMGRTVMLSWEPMFIAAGAITGIRVCTSMLIGGVLCWMVYAPILQSHGIVEGQGFREIVQWTLWPGTACMVTSGILSFAMQWRSAVRAFRSIGTMFKGRKGSAVQDPMDEIETPASWFFAGQAIGFVGLGYLGHVTFGMPYWQTFLAVVLSFALALVACRVTGETDTTPVGAMGKITQLTFGAVNPGNMNVNLMSANVTAGAAGSSADLLTDLKSGYLLGAHPRKQFIAQFAGVFIGCIVPVICFRILVPDASVLGSDEFPAPAALTWAAVAQALSVGLHALGSIKAWSIMIGGLVGIILPLLSRALPKHQKWIPSPAGLGLAWVFHWYYAVLFFTGSLIGAVIEKRHAKWSSLFLFPIASGMIAGESLMGVVLIIWENGPGMVRSLFGF
jgi:OPT family oligopeptide transporter